MKKNCSITFWSYFHGWNVYALRLLHTFALLFYHNTAMILCINFDSLLLCCNYTRNTWVGVGLLLTLKFRKMDLRETLVKNNRSEWNLYRFWQGYKAWLGPWRMKESSWWVTECFISQRERSIMVLRLAEVVQC